MQKFDARNIDKAIDEYVKNNNVEGAFPTGWVVLITVSSSGYDETNQDGYVTVTSEGMPHHTVMGMLDVALAERKNLTLLSMLNQFFTLEDEEDE